MPTKVPSKKKKMKVASTVWTPGEGLNQGKTDFGDFEFHADEKTMDKEQRHGSESFREEDSDKKSKSKQKKDIKKAFKDIKNKLSRKRNKNGVKEISIKPETETPNECWASEVVSINKRGRGSSNASSSRTSSATSKHSKLEDLEEDGIPVIYDAAIQGGEEL